MNLLYIDKLLIFLWSLLLLWMSQYIWVRPNHKVHYKWKKNKVQECSGELWVWHHPSPTFRKCTEKGAGTRLIELLMFIILENICTVKFSIRKRRKKDYKYPSKRDKLEHIYLIFHINWLLSFWLVIFPLFPFLFQLQER